MQDEIKNGLIGMFVLVGLAILTFGILYLHPQTGDEGQTLYVRFNDIDKVTVGTRVTFAGKPVGKVVEIREVPAPRTEHFHDKWIYPYELVLKIDSGVKVYSSDEFSVRTSGLLGERSVAIIPKHPANEMPLVRVSENDVVFATDQMTIDEVFETFNHVAAKTTDVLDAVLGQLDTIAEQKIWENLGTSTSNFADITTALNVPTDWRDSLGNFKNFTVRANRAADSVSEFADRLNTGEGTVSRLVNNDDLFLRLTAVMSKADTIMDDINHYGLLFQNDKGWQRLRARRMNLLQKLSCPQEFYNFFNDEINMISTSLYRVSSVLSETFCQCPPELLLCDEEFEALFADLLRRITALEENIKMYNQQMITEYERGSCCY